MEVREPSITYNKQKISIAEYLEWNASPEKHKYYKGEVFNHWELEEYRKDSQLLPIHTISISLLLSEIYERTNLL